MGSITFESEATANLCLRVIWVSAVDIPQVGRFMFSLTARPESEGFKPTACVSDKKIVFQHGPDLYEVVSDSQIISATGAFRIWVRYDPAFSYPRLPDSGERFGIGAMDSLPSSW